MSGGGGMTAGLLVARVRLLERRQGRASDGRTVARADLIGERAAHVAPIAHGPETVAGRSVPSLDLTVTIRFEAALAGAHLLEWQGARYRIRAVRPDAARRWLTFHARSESGT
ncbi:phage head completion protein [Yunchengibacter salinarum]|uniref:phage head completion protein n=1 Tax=Yunchengibacter salinarum TaxID=3133399 RepID=UPI0035B63916